MPATPAEPGKILSQGEQGEEQPKEGHKTYQSGCGLLLHIIRWTRQEALNAARELTGHMHKPTTKHMKAMRRCMSYLLSTPDRGYFIKPSRAWGGAGEFKFKLMGKSDSECLAGPGCKNANGWPAFLEGCCLAARSKKIPARALPAAEAELYAAAQRAQGLMLEIGRAHV